MSAIEFKPKVGTLIVVADTATNRATPFWEPLIGKKGAIVGVCDDGLWDVTILDAHPLIPGVIPSRFTVIEDTPVTLRHVVDRLVPTFLVLLMLLLAFVVAFVLPSCVNGP